MASHDDLKSYVDTAVDYGADKVDSIIVRGIVSTGSQLRFSQSSIDISKRWERLELELLIALDESKVGITQRAISSVEDSKSIVDDTIEFTRHLPESMLYQGVETSTHSYRQLKGGYDEKFDDAVLESPEIVSSAIDAGLSAGGKRVAGALMMAKSFSFLRSSHGPKGIFQGTRFDLNVRAFQDELDYSGQGLEAGTILSNSEKAMIEAGRSAGELSKQAIGAKQGTPGVYDLVMNPTVAANVMTNIPESANPFMIMIGLSPLGDRMGEQLAPEFVTVHDDATYLGGLGTRAFDFEGSPTQKTTIIENGVLKSFIHNTTTASMYDTKTTGSSDIPDIGTGMKMLLPSPTNTVFAPGTHSMDELLDASKPTIYVTCNWYTRFQNYQMGDFSTIPRDAMFLIEKGEMKPIKNIRISDNTLRMFENIEALGKERKQVFWWEVQTPTIIPAIKVSDCKITAATL